MGSRYCLGSSLQLAHARRLNWTGPNSLPFFSPFSSFHVLNPSIVTRTTLLLYLISHTMLPRSPTTTTLPTNLYLPSQRPFQLPASYHHQTHPDNQFPPHMGFENPALYHHHTVPSMDPSSVDFRAFYPYTPNEVKHRKRTTSAQLKILESIFKRDTKPNATLRNELASQLDMTARGVQVRFLSNCSHSLVV